MEVTNKLKMLVYLFLCVINLVDSRRYGNYGGKYVKWDPKVKPGTIKSSYDTARGLTDDGTSGCKCLGIINGNGYGDTCTNHAPTHLSYCYVNKVACEAAGIGVFPSKSKVLQTNIIGWSYDVCKNRYSMCPKKKKLTEKCFCVATHAAGRIICHSDQYCLEDSLNEHLGVCVDELVCEDYPHQVTCDVKFFCVWDLDSCKEKVCSRHHELESCETDSQCGWKNEGVCEETGCRQYEIVGQQSCVADINCSWGFNRCKENAAQVQEGAECHGYKSQLICPDGFTCQDSENPGKNLQDCEPGVCTCVATES